MAGKQQNAGWQGPHAKKAASTDLLLLLEHLCSDNADSLRPYAAWQPQQAGRTCLRLSAAATAQLEHSHCSVQGVADACQQDTGCCSADYATGKASSSKNISISTPLQNCPCMQVNCMIQLVLLQQLPIGSCSGRCLGALLLYLSNTSHAVAPIMADKVIELTDWHTYCCTLAGIVNGTAAVCAVRNLMQQCLLPPFLVACMQEEQQSLVQHLKQQCSGMAAVLPFASTTIVKASSSTQAEIYFGLAKAVDVSGRLLTAVYTAVCVLQIDRLLLC
jgi:hypothetical protein